MIECVIFDCDGTLVDSEVLCNLGLKIKLKEFGIKVDTESMVTRFRGWKLIDIVSVLSKEHNLKLDNTFITSYRQLVGDLFNSQLRPILNIEIALANICQPKCVASNAPLNKIEQAIKVTNLERFFAGNLFSSYTIQAWKPEPDLFLYAAKMMNVQPKNCIVVEDSILGIKAAEAAGMKSLYFQPDGGTFLKDINAISFSNMLDLPGLIESS